MLRWIRDFFGAQPKKSKIFISYDHDEDMRFKHLLRAWDKNADFDFEIDESSPKGKINSKNEAVVKAALTRKIKQSDCLMVIVGRATYKSKWVQWEIEQAKLYGLQLIAIKLERGFKTPKLLLNAGTSWAMDFSQQSISKALKEAKKS